MLVFLYMLKLNVQKNKFFYFWILLSAIMLFTYAVFQVYNFASSEKVEPQSQYSVKLLPVDSKLIIDPNTQVDFKKVYFGMYKGEPAFLLESDGDYGYQKVIDTASKRVDDAKLSDLKNIHEIINMDISELSKDIFDVYINKNKTIAYLGLTLRDEYAGRPQVNVIFKVDLKSFSVEEVTNSHTHPELYLYLSIDDLVEDRYLVIDAGECGPCDIVEARQKIIVDSQTKLINNLGGVTEVTIDTENNSVSFKKLVPGVETARGCSVMNNGKVDESNCEEWEVPTYKPEDVIQTVPLLP